MVIKKKRIHNLKKMVYTEENTTTKKTYRLDNFYVFTVEEAKVVWVIN